MIGSGLLGRWRLSVVLTVIVLLCKETAAAATLGWGLYMFLFTARRKSGAALASGSIAYALLCIHLIIPCFAASGTYERASLFGSLGDTIPAVLVSMFTEPGLFFARLIRSESIYFVCMLLVPMGLLPLWRWRLLVAAAPSLLLILLLDNPDWLSLKFWHQATVLPLVFTAGVATLMPSRDAGTRARRPSAGADIGADACEPLPHSPEAGRTDSRGDLAARLLLGRDVGPGSINLGIAVGVCFAAAWAHYFFAYSPLAKPYEVYASVPALHLPDPRLETVRRLRNEIPRSSTIVATERLAAHFTDYKRIYTGVRLKPADVVIIDRADTWDATGLPANVLAYQQDPDYDLYGVFDSIVVFVRSDDAPPVSFDD
jgi:hypothetical protein